MRITRGFVLKTALCLISCDFNKKRDLKKFEGFEEVEKFELKSPSKGFF